MKCKGCKPQDLGAASDIKCAAGTYTEEKCYAVGNSCAGKAIYTRTVDKDCTVLAFSYVDGEGEAITKAQWDAIVTIACPDRSFNCAPTPELCDLVKAAIAGATVVTPVGTDKIQVVRDDGSCAIVDLSAMLVDIQIQSVVGAVYNPATGQLTFSITETNGDVYPFSVQIGPWVETPLSVRLIDGAGNNITATNVTLSGPANHTVEVRLPPDPVEPPLQIILKDAAGNNITATNVIQSGTANHIAEITLPPQTVDVNVSNLTLDAAGNLLLTETDGQTHQVNIPASPALVVTKNGSTDGVVQSGTLGHIVDIAVETTEVYVNGVAVPDSDPSATNRRYDITVPAPLVCPDAAAVAVELCPADEFVGLTCVAGEMVPQKFAIKQTIAHVPAQVTRGGAVDLAAVCGAAAPKKTIEWENVAQGAFGADSWGTPWSGIQGWPAITNVPFGSATYAEGDLVVVSIEMQQPSDYNDHGRDPPFSADASLNLVDFALIRREVAGDQTNPTSTCTAANNCVAFPTWAYIQVWAGIVGPGGGTGGFNLQFNPNTAQGGIYHVSQCVWTIDKTNDADVSAGTVAGALIGSTGGVGNFSTGPLNTTGKTPLTASLPTFDANTYWVLASRHVGNSSGGLGATWTGGTKLTDVNSGNILLGPFGTTATTVCNAYMSSAYSATGTITMEVDGNITTFADSCCRDVYVGLAFKAKSDAAGAYATNLDASLSLTAPSSCGNQYSALVSMGGGSLTGTLGAGAQYKVRYELNTAAGVYEVGQLVLSNTSATAQPFAVPAPSVLLKWTAIGWRCSYGDRPRIC
jgi:hypothetical protein